MAKFKPPKRLFKNQEMVHTYQNDREKRTSYKHMVRDHVDVLQNIEFALVQLADEDSSIDDSVIHQALQAQLKGLPLTDSADSREETVHEALVEFRLARDDVSDAIWSAGLRTVAESVRNHSGLTAGEKNYLNFVRRYVR